MVAHGLAASIRSARENETFDLGGHNASNITSTMKSAFKEPFDLGEMIRLTFVTGAGKQSRQRYDDGAAKALTAVLKEYGYEEDRGASCILQCAGSYKSQHDTGKNLYTVVVFPKISKKANGNLETDTDIPSLIPEDSAEYAIAISSMNVFKNMVKSKCPSWSQKKGCLSAIEDLKQMIRDIENSMMRGQIDPSQQAFYDAVSDLDDKESHVRHEIQAHVSDGTITKFEKDLLLKQNAERIETLQNEKKPTAKALQRKELLESIEPEEPCQLKYHAELGKLWKELSPLLQLEAQKKGKLLSVKETQLMSKKDEIVEEIQDLEQASRGWFEEDDVFESRVEAARAKFAASNNKKGKKVGGVAMIGADTTVNVSVSKLGKFVTPTRGTVKKVKKKGKLKGPGVFAAMMDRNMDNSDDSSDEDSNANDNYRVEQNMNEKKKSESKVKMSSGKDATKSSAAETSNKKKSKKKKNKKKNNNKSKQAAEAVGEVEPELDEDQIQSEMERSNKEQQKAVKSGSGSFLQIIIVVIVAWFFTSLFSEADK